MFFYFSMFVVIKNLDRKFSSKKVLITPSMLLKQKKQVYLYCINHKNVQTLNNELFFLYI